MLIKKTIIFIFFVLINFTTFTQNTLKEKVIASSKNKDMKKLLMYKILLDNSPSGRFVFINAFATQSSNIDRADMLKESFIIDGFKFNKGEFRWWFVYDFEKNKIIFKGSDMILFQKNMLNWDEKNGYLILNGPFGNYTEFYNLYNPEKEMFYLFINKNFKFSDNGLMIAYQLTTKYSYHGLQLNPSEIGIRIRDLQKGKDVFLIKSEYEYSTLDILRWESNDKIIYNETNKDKNILDEKVFNLSENVNNGKYLIKKYTIKSKVNNLINYPYYDKKDLEKIKVDKGDKLDILNQIIEYDKNTNNNWVFVLSEKGVTGYCHFNDLELCIEANQSIIAKYYTPKVNVLRFRESPSLDGKYIRTLKKDEKLELLETGKEEMIDGTKGHWIKVKTEQGETGWCFDGYLEEVKE